MFRNPLYLNLNLLQNLADYMGIELVTDTEVTRQTVDERRGRVGIKKVVDVSGEKGSTAQVTEVYTTSFRPVRAMNDVIDALLRSDDLVDLATNPDAAFSQRDVIQIEGTLSISPVTEMGALMAQVTPLLVDQASKGKKEFDLKPADVGKILLEDQPGDFVHVLELNLGDERPAAYVLAMPSNLFGSATMDDLTGELTILATVDRLVDAGGTFSLERHLMPGLNRTVRRAIGSHDLSDMLRSFATDVLGRTIDPDAISVKGPA